MSNVFGTPKFGNSGGNYKKTRTVGAGVTAFRPLPPMFSLRETGEWRKYWPTHWGYSVPGDRDASKMFQKPFRCILDKDRRNGLVRQECPACTKWEQVEKEAREMEQAIRTEMVGKDPAVIEARVEKELTPIREWLKDHRMDGKWFVNAMFEDGSFGSIKLNHKFHMNRMLEIINGKNDGKSPPVPGLLEAEGINPLDPSQGVWFVVHRTGSKLSVVDTTDIKMENVVAEVNGKPRTLKQIVMAPLTEEQCEQAGKDCEDLATLGGDDLTYEQIDALVNGTVVPEKDEPATSSVDFAKQVSAEIELAKQAEAKKAAAAKQMEADRAAKKSTDEEAVASEPKQQDPGAAQKEAIQKRLADIKARQEAQAQAEVARKAAADAAAIKAAADAAPTAPPIDIASMSDEEFTRTFGTGAG